MSYAVGSDPVFEEWAKGQSIDLQNDVERDKAKTKFLDDVTMETFGEIFANQDTLASSAKIDAEFLLKAAQSYISTMPSNKKWQWFVHCSHKVYNHYVGIIESSKTITGKARDVSNPKKDLSGTTKKHVGLLQELNGGWHGYPSIACWFEELKDGAVHRGGFGSSYDSGNPNSAEQLYGRALQAKAAQILSGAGAAVADPISPAESATLSAVAETAGYGAYQK